MPASASSETPAPARTMTTAARWQIAACAVVGLLAAVAVLVVGSGLAGGSVRWWIQPSLGVGSLDQEIALYVAMGALTVAWLVLGRQARSSVMTPQVLWVIAALWSLPLVVSAPMFSRDVYSYLGQGTILHLGHNPYHDPPTVLAHLGHMHVLRAVDPFWRHTTAPYGPLFLGVVSAIVTGTGQDVVLGAQVIKLLGLVGLVLLAVFVPRLARAQGGDPSRAIWLAALNPIVLFALVVPGHNDLLMVGLMVAGVALAVEGHPLWGVGVCAVAAMVKLPAAAAALFIAVAWARSVPDLALRIRRLAQSATMVVGAFLVVSLATGVGASWVTSALFSAPGRVKLAITPSSGLACTLSSALGDGCLKISATFVNLQTIFRIVVGVLTVLIVLEMLRRTRPPTLTRWLGLALLALAWGGPAAWPWYFIWGLALLAATPGPLTLLWSVILMVAGAFAVKPGGILALPLQSAPWVMGTYALAAVAAWYSWRRSRGSAASTTNPTAPERLAAPPLADAPNSHSALAKS